MVISFLHVFKRAVSIWARHWKKLWHDSDMKATPNAQSPAARSYLFVPGDRPERFDKAWASAADEVILDLEDSVAHDHKITARSAVANWLDASRPVWIRINATDTEWFIHDLELAERPGVVGLLLPKAEQLPASLTKLCAKRSLNLLPIIETAKGMHAVEYLATAPQVVRLAFGALDFQVDLDIIGDDDALLYFRSCLVLASRLARLPAPVDGVTVSIDDASVLRADTERSRRLGFGAKLCIHPNQIAEVHCAFSPSADERDWAARVLAAMQASGGAVASLNGKMIDRPVWQKAMRISNAPMADRRLRP